MDPELPPGLNYSKNLVIEVQEIVDVGLDSQDYCEEMNDGFGEFLLRVLLKMPHLQSFKYVFKADITRSN